MKFLHVVIAVLSVTVFAQSYSEDKSEIYTANNEVEDTLTKQIISYVLFQKLKQSNLSIRDLIKHKFLMKDATPQEQEQMLKLQAQGGQQQQGAAEVEIASTMIVDAKSAFSELQQKDYIEVNPGFILKVIILKLNHHTIGIRTRLC